jgi:hypothetical protein
MSFSVFLSAARIEVMTSFRQPCLPSTFGAELGGFECLQIGHFIAPPARVGHGNRSNQWWLAYSTPKKDREIPWLIRATAAAEHVCRC